MSRPKDSRTDESRRRALKLILASAALPLSAGCASNTLDTGNPGTVASERRILPRQTATDPDLVNPTVPWPLQLSDEELVTVAALADRVLPADERSPSASQVGVPAFIDEWVSAPYENQQNDLLLLREGLAWLDGEAGNRAGKAFHEAETAVQLSICEDICDEASTPEALQPGARFFNLFRRLCLAGYYTTEAGRRDLGYVGNVPLPGDFPGATDEQKEFLGL